MGGIYCVHLDPDIVGTEDPVFWAFANEGDADDVAAFLNEREGDDKAWTSYQPISTNMRDAHLLDVLAERYDVKPATVLRNLRRIAGGVIEA